MSVNLGDTENFKVQTTASSWHIDILRLGYYGGDGARLIATNIQPSAPQPQTQPPCLSSASTGLIDCGNWAVSASWTVPTTAVSGVYIAELVRNDTGGKSQIPFVVRDDASHSDIIYQTSDETWEAYNTWGGNSLYQCGGSPPPAPFSSDTDPVCPPGNPQGYQGAFAVSYNRPWDTAITDNGESWLFNAEFPMIEFLEEQGYDVTYTSGSDVDANGSLLLNHKVFISSGHDEYWSAAQRANVTNARDHGVNLAFFSGNEIFWKTRWGASIDGSNTPYRTLITYKETHFNAPTDPEDPGTWTGSWEDPRFSPPADGDDPGNSLTGQYFAVNEGTTDIQVPSQYAPELLWRNTAVAKLQPGKSVTLGPPVNVGQQIGTLGYEWDIDADNGFRPPGEIDLSIDHRERQHPRPGLRRLRDQRRAGDGHPSPEPVQSGQRGLRLRCRHRPVRLRARQLQPGGRRARPEHGAVHGQSLRAHGRATGHPHRRPGAGLALQRHRAAHLYDHLARSQRHAHRRRPGHHHRDRDRQQRRGGGRRRGLDRRRQHLAPGDGHPWRVHDLVLQLAGRARQPDRDH